MGGVWEAQDGARGMFSMQHEGGLAHPIFKNISFCFTIKFS